MPETFDFEDVPVAFRRGDTLAAALTSAGQMALREAGDGSRRGVFCGMGVCQECLVQVDGRPSQRACMTSARAGMLVARQPARPRAVAPDAGAEAREPRNLTPDVLVVGGGPAGMAAALAAAATGLEVVLADERAKLGGQYFKQPAGGFEATRGPALDPQFRAGSALIDQVAAAGIEVLPGTSIWGAFAPDHLEAIGPAGRVVLTPRALVLAPGAYEVGVPFPGWTLPGVITTGAAQTLWRSYGVTPGERVLVSGNGPLNMQVAAELTRAGATVVALAEIARPLAPRRLAHLTRMALADPGLIRDGARYRATLARAHVPVIYEASVIRVDGEDRARTATVAKLDGDGRPRHGSERRFDVDAVCLGFGFTPSTELARALGAEHVYDPRARQLVTVTGPRGATTLPRVWVIGDGAGINGAHMAQARGTLAGLDAARALGRMIAADQTAAEAQAQRRARRHRHFQGALAEVFRAPVLVDQLAEADTLVCRCESVSRLQIERALGDGAGHVGAIKRVTRAGMGPCQGRYCGPLLAELVAREAGVQVNVLSGYAPNPPHKPVPISELAEQPLSPEAIAAVAKRLSGTDS
jgi:NADPH-dependent 2,4-dienoyl-CoA reductase/sulfur reductase-like enzyme